jgi:hypothetical protein
MEEIRALPVFGFFGLKGYKIPAQGSAGVALGWNLRPFQGVTISPSAI